MFGALCKGTQHLIERLYVVRHNNVINIYPYLLQLELEVVCNAR